MYGGEGRLDANGNREVNPLQLDNLTWQRAIGAKTTDFLHDHSAATVARTKMMVFGWVQTKTLVNAVM